MAPPQSIGASIDMKSNKCSLPLPGPDGKIVYFDVQTAEPGTFIVPGVIDVELYKPRSFVETSWIYFKGDPQSGPQPGHPFDMPFDNHNTTFQLDLVHENDKAEIVRQIMCRCLPIYTGRHKLIVP